MSFVGRQNSPQVRLKVTRRGKRELRHVSSVCRSRSRDSVQQGGSTADDPMSDNSSDMSLPEHVVYPSLEESWLVTPPPCFTAGGTSPEHMQSSPMEDLLIEHPSMSVYTARGRPGSTGADSELSSEDDSVVNPPEPTAVLAQPVHRPHAVAAHAGLTAHVKAVKIMQAAEKRHADRRIGRKNLERNNKVRDYQANAKRHQRSKKYAIKPSGVCNNRRC